MEDPALMALQRVLLTIEEGAVAKTAKAAGLTHSALARLRRGEKLNVKVLSLVRLARAMGKTTDEMLGLAPPSGFSRVPTTVGSSPGLSSRDEARLRKKLARIAAVVSEAEAMLPPGADDVAPEE